MIRPAVLLCDADGNLFPSEEPAFEASTVVTNRFLEAIGADRRYGADELRREAMGRNFRAMSTALAGEHGVALRPDDLDRYVEQERMEVTLHLSRTLRPDPDVLAPLRQITESVAVAVVSSSASARLDACFEATGLDQLFPPAVRFSAEDSLASPASKPDPAVYVHACEALGVPPATALAVEDAIAGVRSAVAAGVPVVGNLLFVPEGERAERATALEAAGARTVAESWWEILEMVGG